MLRQAQLYRGDVYAPGEPGYVDPSTLRWVDEPDFDLRRIKLFRNGDAATAAYLAEEVKQRALENHSVEVANAYVEKMGQAILDSTIDPILIVQGADDEFYIWDGWHRMAMAYVLNHNVLHAWVGYRQ
jgi:hypothetical protein